jgi:hypothetical protein
MRPKNEACSSGTLRYLGIYLMLISFMVRALVPAGYMPQWAAADGEFPKLAICTASGLKFIAVQGSHDRPAPSDHNDHGDQPCAYATFAAFTFPGLSAQAEAPVAYAPSVFLPRLATVRPPVRAGPGHAIRGPPSIV